MLTNYVINRVNRKHCKICFFFCRILTISKSLALEKNEKNYHNNSRISEKETINMGKVSRGATKSQTDEQKKLTNIQSKQSQANKRIKD